MKYSMLVTSALYNVTSGTPVFNAVIFFHIQIIFSHVSSTYKKKHYKEFFYFLFFPIYIFLNYFLKVDSLFMLINVYSFIACKYFEFGVLE